MLGAIIGDIVGSVYEFNNNKSKDVVLFSKESRPTDDTIMTLAVAEIMQNKYYYDKDKIINTFKKWGRRYPYASYGIGFGSWLSSNDKEPYNSFGNGAAMRISPVGWYGRSEEEVKYLAKCVTEVTHNHPEGLKGAEVTAMCIYYARIGKSKEFIKEYVSKHYKLNFDYNSLVEFYKFNETCQETVPQAIYCFLISNSFEDCLRTSISIGGDTDTLCAISCAIAEAYYKNIPEYIYQKVFHRLDGICYWKKDNNFFSYDKDVDLIIQTFIREFTITSVVTEEITNDTLILCMINDKTKACSFVWSKSLKALIDYFKMYEYEEHLGKYFLKQGLTLVSFAPSICDVVFPTNDLGKELNTLSLSLTKEGFNLVLEHMNQIMTILKNHKEKEKKQKIIKYKLFNTPEEAYSFLNEKINVGSNICSEIFNKEYIIK